MVLHHVTLPVLSNTAMRKWAFLIHFVHCPSQDPSNHSSSNEYETECQGRCGRNDGNVLVCVSRRGRKGRGRTPFRWLEGVGGRLPGVQGHRVLAWRCGGRRRQGLAAAATLSPPCLHLLPCRYIGTGAATTFAGIQTAR
jgi:hypothetical protein